MTPDEPRRAEAEVRVKRFLASGGEWPSRQVPDPAPAPRVPWHLTVNDRRFLRGLKIEAD